ncbi:MAG: hypothetical protein CMJ97_03310 [Planctomycetes bacterium]|nr:hypothetical protein [Planctomycetota bacterium]
MRLYLALYSGSQPVRKRVVFSGNPIRLETSAIIGQDGHKMILMPARELYFLFRVQRREAALDLRYRRTVQ